MSNTAAQAGTQTITRVAKPTVYHYHRRNDIAFSQITGASIKALCGVQGAVGATPTAVQGTDGRGAVCPSCTNLHALLFAPVSD